MKINPAQTQLAHAIATSQHIADQQAKTPQQWHQIFTQTLHNQGITTKQIN